MKKQGKYPAPFSLRLSGAERQKLKELAASRPIGEFIRDSIFSKGARPITRKNSINDTKQLAKLLSTLGKSRIANNLNQLAKAANSGSLPVNEEVLRDIWEAVQHIRWMRDTLIKAIGIKPQSKESDDEEEDSHDT